MNAILLIQLLNVAGLGFFKQNQVGFCCASGTAKMSQGKGQTELAQ